MVPGRDGTGQDLETLKVPWSRGPGTKEVQKSRDLKIGIVPGQWKPYQIQQPIPELGVLTFYECYDQLKHVYKLVLLTG